MKKLGIWVHMNLWNSHDKHNPHFVKKASKSFLPKNYLSWICLGRRMTTELLHTTGSCIPKLWITITLTISMLPQTTRSALLALRSLVDVFRIHSNRLFTWTTTWNWFTFSSNLFQYRVSFIFLPSARPWQQHVEKVLTSLANTLHSTTCTCPLVIM